MCEKETNKTETEQLGLPAQTSTGCIRKSDILVVTCALDQVPYGSLSLHCAID
jgi:hypothetical protein